MIIKAKTEHTANSKITTVAAIKSIMTKMIMIT